MQEYRGRHGVHVTSEGPVDPGDQAGPYVRLPFGAAVRESGLIAARPIPAVVGHTIVQLAAMVDAALHAQILAILTDVEYLLASDARPLQRPRIAAHAELCLVLRTLLAVGTALVVAAAESLQTHLVGNSFVVRAALPVAALLARRAFLTVGIAPTVAALLGAFPVVRAFVVAALAVAALLVVRALLVVGTALAVVPLLTFRAVLIVRAFSLVGTVEVLLVVGRTLLLGVLRRTGIAVLTAVTLDLRARRVRYIIYYRVTRTESRLHGVTVIELFLRRQRVFIYRGRQAGWYIAQEHHLLALVRDIVIAGRVAGEHLERRRLLRPRTVLQRKQRRGPIPAPGRFSHIFIFATCGALRFFAICLQRRGCLLLGLFFLIHMVLPGGLDMLSRLSQVLIFIS